MAHITRKKKSKFYIRINVLRIKNQKLVLQFDVQ